MSRFLSIALAIGAMAVPAGPAIRPAPRPWTIAVCGPASDTRRDAVAEAVDFWNETFAQLKIKFSLGPVSACDRTAPDDELARLSQGVLGGGRTGRLPRELEGVSGDVIIALSGTDLISVGLRGAGGHEGLVIFRRPDIPPLSLPNVMRNVAAHELGHVLGLSHNADPATLMCGRPAPCLPALFRSDTRRFFPLTDADRRALANRFR